jgi:hypothetical protein
MGGREGGEVPHGREGVRGGTTWEGGREGGREGGGEVPHGREGGREGGEVPHGRERGVSYL